jgi:RHS repeat-associated protein
MRSRWSRPSISEPPRYTQGKSKPMQAAQAAKEKMSTPVFSLAASAAATTKSAGTNPIPIPDAWPCQHVFFKTNPTSGLARNSRLGHQLPTAVLYQGLGPAISNTATGFGDPLYDFHVRPRCTGKERDAETGLDFFGARYFSGAQGRFTSADQPFADQDPSDPQSWNLYNYARNNPLRYTDADGRECVTLDNGATGDNGKGSVCQAVVDADKKKKPDITVTANQYGSTYAFDFRGNYIPGSFRPPTAKETAIHDDTVNLASNLSLAGDAAKVGFAFGPLAVVVGKDALQHILAQHAANTLAQSVSKFAAGLSKDAIESLINTALRDGTVTQGSKVAFHDLDLGVSIGTNQAGQTTSTIRVLVDNATGKAITAYPK